MNNTDKRDHQLVLALQALGNAAEVIKVTYAIAEPQLTEEQEKEIAGKLGFINLAVVGIETME